MNDKFTTNRLADHWNSMADQSREMVDDYPLTALLAAFGIGVVAGLACSAVLMSPSSSSARHWLPEGTGAQFLQSLTGVVPQ